MINHNNYNIVRLSHYHFNNRANKVFHPNPLIPSPSSLFNPSPPPLPSFCAIY